MEKDIDIKVEVFLVYKGKPILDYKLAEILRLIGERGSILAACRSLGLPYSRVWERICSVERVLGIKLIEAKRGGRGGGGATLTSYARKLLELYSRAVERIKPCASLLKQTPTYEKPPPELAVIGSHDPLLEHLIGILRSKGLRDIEVQWVGSLGGLASIILGEADIAGIHLYDPDTEVYNKPYITKLPLEGEVVLVKGYERELVFALRPTLNINSVNEVIDMLASGKLTLANRIRHSGTRIYLNHLFKKYNVNTRNIKGYETEYRTHFDVASAVALGKADVCLTLKHIAKIYSLKTVHVIWEHYDFIIPRSKMKKHSVKLFLETLKNLRSIVRKPLGYKITEDTGEIIYG